MDDPRAQSQYQVRFACGVAGERELAGADLVLLCDELASAEEPAAPRGEGAPEAAAGGPDAAPGASALVTIATAETAARSVLAEQEARGRRVSVAVIAADPAGASFPLPGILAAGAVIEALADLGIDHCSPEAAAAAAAYAGLAHATRHLVSASVPARLARA